MVVARSGSVARSSSNGVSSSQRESLFIPVDMEEAGNDVSVSETSQFGQSNTQRGRESVWMPTEFARGPWDKDALHGGPVAALLARDIEEYTGELETASSDTNASANSTAQKRSMVVVRITVELLRPVPMTPLRVSSRILRPGRRVQLLEASIKAGEKEVARATALELRTGTIELPGKSLSGYMDTSALTPPPPESGTPMADDNDMVDYIAFHNSAVDMRFVAGAFREKGPATAWIRLTKDIVLGDAPTPLQRVMAVSDFGNGISSILGFDSHIFINPDLTVYLTRMPIGEWVCLDASTQVADIGVGLAQSAVWDRDGQIGHALQSLLVEER